MGVLANLKFLARFAETFSIDLAGGALPPHLLEYPGDLNPGGDYASGTTSSTQDRVWTDRRTVANGTPDDIDLSGALSGVLNATVSFVEVRGICIINRSSTLGQILEVGGDAAAAFANFFGAANDIIKVGPSGCLFLYSPLDTNGLTVTNSSADILQIASASGSITYDIGIWGVSA